MTFDPTNSRLFDPFTKADLPVLKHVVFTPGVDSTFAHPIHLQYVRDTMRGHGVQVVEEVSAGVQRTLLVFFVVAHPDIATIPYPSADDDSGAPGTTWRWDANPLNDFPVTGWVAEDQLTYPESTESTP